MEQRCARHCDRCSIQLLKLDKVSAAGELSGQWGRLPGNTVKVPIVLERPRGLMRWWEAVSHAAELPVNQGMFLNMPS